MKTPTHFRQKSHLAKELICILFCAIIFPNNLFAQKPDSDKRLTKELTDNHYMAIDVNNIKMWMSNNGNNAYDPTIGGSGLYWPKGGWQTAIYADGVIWGGKIRIKNSKQLNTRVGGSTYRYGLQGGKVLHSVDTVFADDAQKSKYRVYKIDKNLNEFKKKTSWELDYLGYTKDDILQMEKDYNEWPVSDGAPSNPDGSPRFIGDQTLWYVANDLNKKKTTSLYGSLPMGIEMQKTIWGYRGNELLQNTVFTQTKIINVSADTIFDMYFSLWSDPDLGDANDDFIGCDTTLGLGYVYNGREKDAIYSDGVVPSAGYIVLGSPVEKGSFGDSTYFDFKWNHNFKNSKMSSFIYFVSGNSNYSDPPMGTGFVEFYNYQKGINGTGSPYIDPTTMLPTKFVLAGDPILKKGYYDGIEIPPGDRRVMMNYGPFTFLPGDTQTITFAHLISRGKLASMRSISKLKYETSLIKSLIHNGFDLPIPPPTPELESTSLDEKIVLSWDGNADQNSIENWSSRGFKFEGYNLYQVPLDDAIPDFKKAKLLASFDLKNDVTNVTEKYFNDEIDSYGTIPRLILNNKGLSYYFEVDHDIFNGNKMLKNHIPYRFVLTSFAVNQNYSEYLKVLESPVKIIEVKPASVIPGTSDNAENGNQISLTKTVSLTDSKPLISATVKEPQRITGDVYSVQVSDTNSLGKTVSWIVVNETKGKQVGKSEEINVTYSPYSDGIEFNVWDDAIRLPQIEHSLITKYNGESVNNGEGVDFFGRYPAYTVPNFRINYYLNGNLANRLRLNSDIMNYRDFELRFTQNGSLGYWKADSLFGKVPFEIWDVTKNKRMIPLLQSYKDSTAGKFDYSKNGISDVIYFCDGDYSNFELDALDGKYDGNSLFFSKCPIGYLTIELVFPYNDLPPNETTIKFVTNKAMKFGEKWSLETKNLVSQSSVQISKSQLNKINVFPNPYFGNSSLEYTKYFRAVTFTYLPKHAKINIYTISGVHVRTIEKNDDSQYAQWDLLNNSHLVVASGVYVAYIETDYGCEILKLSIIQEVPYLDRI